MFNNQLPQGRFMSAKETKPLHAPKALGFDDIHDF